MRYLSIDSVSPGAEGRLDKPDVGTAANQATAVVGGISELAK